MTIPRLLKVIVWTFAIAFITRLTSSG